MKRPLHFALALWVAIAGPASAALIQFASVVDISGCPPTFCSIITPVPTQTFSVGDTIDFSVVFADGARLELYDDNGGAESFFGWMDNVGTGGTFTITNASIQFDGLIGSLVNPLTLASQTSGSAHIGPAFALDFVGTGSSISFSGYQVQYTVTALPANPNTYGSNWLITQADRIAVVPEPGGLALLGIGLAGAGLVRRRGALARLRAPESRL